MTPPNLAMRVGSGTGKPTEEAAKVGTVEMAGTGRRLDASEMGFLWIYFLVFPDEAKKLP